MIYIITGEINSGKSTFLLSLFNRSLLGDGFYNRRIFASSTCIGQEIVHLSTGITFPFSYRLDHLPDQWDELYTYREHSFSRTGLLFCREIMRNMMNTQEPSFIDEIGPLELQEKGLYEEFKELILKKKDIYVVIRNRCLSEVLSKFKINDYILMKK